MAERRIGIIMNGVTGRMGTNQHLVRSIAAIRADGGVKLANGDRLMPDPILVGRNRDKLEALARAHDVARVSTDLDACLADPKDELFFEAATTQLRAGLIRQAIAAGKHIYVEKPTADRLEDALDVARLARRGRHQARRGAGQAVPARTAQAEDGDRQRLPRPHLQREGRVRLLGLRGRPAAGAAAILELQGGRGRRHHPRYALPLALRAGQSVRRGRGGVAASAPRISPNASARTGKPYKADVDDAAYATFQLKGGVVAHINSQLGDARAARRPRDLPGGRHAWQRHRRPAEMLDAVARQHAEAGLEPRHPAADRLLRRLAGSAEQPGLSERLPRAVGDVPALPRRRDAELPLGPDGGRQGVQLAEAGLRSWRERRWIDLEKLEA